MSNQEERTGEEERGRRGSWARKRKVNC